VIQRQSNSEEIEYIDILDPISFKVAAPRYIYQRDIPFNIRDIHLMSADASGRLFFITTDNKMFRFGTDGFQPIQQFNDTRPPVTMVRLRRQDLLV